MAPPKPAKEPKQKSRMAVRMKEAAGVAKARNQSADLVKLQEQFHAFVKKLKSLVIVMKQHHGSMMALQKTRLAVAHEVAKLAERSPIYDNVSALPAPDREGVCSYLSIHSKVADKSKSYISKYAQFVVEYTIEWEKVVTGRISVGLKKAEDLRRDLDHYQQKVESLRQSANQAMAKGKNVDSKAADRLSRNEEKFIKSKQEYDVFATDLCILIEEVTDRSWRDLHPLMIKLAQFDMTMSDDESKAMGTLTQVVKELKDMAQRNGLSPQPRLKDIEHQKPNLLSTRGAGGDLRIEAGEATNGSVFGSPTGAASPSLPPGSVGPQGLGGFPVQVNDGGSKIPPPRSSSFASYDSGMGSGIPDPYAAPSTSDIVQMGAAAAPPPTFDQVSSSQNPYGRSSSSGGLPPLGPGGGAYNAGGGDAGSAYGGSAYGAGSNYGSNYGGSAYGSTDALSVYSGASAPAPAAAPPPPPPPPMAPPLQPTYPPQAQQPSWNQQPSYGQPPPSNPYGQPGAPNPFGQPPAPSYGAPPAPNPFGQPPPQQQQQAPNPYGAPPPPQQAPNPFGQAPPLQQQYGGGSTNPYNPF